jgi:hypothetical protein
MLADNWRFKPQLKFDLIEEYDQENCIYLGIEIVCEPKGLFVKPFLDLFQP